jgi:hypothetical protein
MTVDGGLGDDVEGLDLDAIVAVVAADVGEPGGDVRDAVEEVIRLALGPAEPGTAAAIVEADGERAARDGMLPEQLIDRYLSTLWAIWEVRAAGSSSRGSLVMLGDRLLHAADELVAAVAEGYRAVERELIVRNAEARRAFLEELLGAVAVDTTSIGRLRRVSARNGVDPSGNYRLIAIAATDSTDDTEAELLAGRLRLVIGRPSSLDRSRAGVRLPQVLAWRGRVLVLARASWPGLPGLRDGLGAAAGDAWTAVISPSTSGVQSLAPALARLLETLRTAGRLGHHGWIEHPDDLAVERLMLADDVLLATIVDRELGPLLDDARMGDELVRTLRVYFDAGENMRETGRRLHLANRTVAYRLERIAKLLGHPLDGDARQRLVIALLARRILSGKDD